MSGSTPEPGIRYHWVIAFQWGGVNSSPMAYLEGTFTPAPGQTRQQAFRQLRDHAIADNENAGHRHPGDPVVVFFSLEPDELPVPAAPDRAEG